MAKKSSFKIKKTIVENEAVIASSKKRNAETSATTQPKTKKHKPSPEIILPLTKKSHQQLVSFLNETSLISNHIKHSPGIQFQHIIFKSSIQFLSLVSSLKISNDPHMFVDFKKKTFGCVGFSANKRMLVLNEYSLSNPTVFLYPNFMDFDEGRNDRIYLCVKSLISKSITKTNLNHIVFSFPLFGLTPNPKNPDESIIHDVFAYITQIPMLSLNEILKDSSNIKCFQNSIPPATSTAIKTINDAEIGIFPRSFPTMENFIMITFDRKTLLKCLSDIQAKQETTTKTQDTEQENLTKMTKFNLKVQLQSNQLILETSVATYKTGFFSQKCNLVEYDAEKLQDVILIEDIDQIIHQSVTNMKTQKETLSMELSPQLFFHKIETEEFELGLIFDHLKLILTSLVEDFVTFVMSNDFPLSVRCIHDSDTFKITPCVLSTLIVQWTE